MSTKVIGILLAIIVVVGGAYYLTKNGSLSEGLMNAQTGATTDTTTTTGAAGAMSLRELIASGISQQCAFSDASGPIPTQGTVYVGGGKVRGDFSATSQGQSMGMHMISDGTMMHTWLDGTTEGFKMSMTASQSASGAPQGFDADKKFDYRCSPWATDDSKFVLPSGVTFRDMSAMMQGVMKK